MMSSGKLFQSWAAATGKARLPTVDSLTGGTTRRLESAERSARRPARSATRTSGPFTAVSCYSCKVVTKLAAQTISVLIYSLSK